MLTYPPVQPSVAATYVTVAYNNLLYARKVGEKVNENMLILKIGYSQQCYSQTLLY